MIHLLRTFSGLPVALRIKKCISCQGLESLCDLPIFNLDLVALTLSHYSWIPLSQGLVVKRWSGLSWLWAFCTCYFLFLECSCSLHTGSFASFFRSQFEGYQPQEACGGSKLSKTFHLFMCHSTPFSHLLLIHVSFFIIVYSVVCLLIKNTSTISVLITTVYPESIIPPPGMWQLYKHLLNKLMKSVYTLHLCYWNCCVLELLSK